MENCNVGTLEKAYSTITARGECYHGPGPLFFTEVRIRRSCAFLLDDIPRLIPFSPDIFLFHSSPGICS